MRFIKEEIYHVYNRGNNRQRIFFSDEQYQYFLKKIRKEWMPYCEILAWCLMPNHFHFMLMANAASCKEIPSYGGKPMQELARKIGLTLSSYAQFINKQNNTTGSLFQQKTKAKCLTCDNNISGKNTNFRPYAETCAHYIHQNPISAGLVTRMEDWPYSSFKDYAGLRNGSLCNKELMFERTSIDKKNFYKESYQALDEELVKCIW